MFDQIITTYDGDTSHNYIVGNHALDLKDLILDTSPNVDLSVDFLLWNYNNGKGFDDFFANGHIDDVVAINEMTFSRKYRKFIYLQEEKIGELLRYPISKTYF